MKNTHHSYHIVKSLFLILTILLLNACGGGGDGGNNQVTSETTTNDNVTIINADKKSEILSNPVKLDNNKNITLGVTNKLANTLKKGDIFILPAGIDKRFPLGVSGKIEDKLSSSSTQSKLTLSKIYLTDIVKKSKQEETKIALNEKNFVGVIAPPSVTVNQSTKKKYIGQNVKSYLDGGVVFVKSSSKKEKSFLGDDGKVALGKIDLNLTIKLKDITSNFKPYGQTKKEAKVIITGNLSDLEIKESHDIDLFNWDLDPYIKTNMGVKGKFNAGVRFEAGAKAVFGKHEKVWGDVEKVALEKFGIREISGLDGSDKIGKYPIVGLVFVSSTPLIIKNTTLAVNTAKTGGFIVWVYLNARGEVSIDGAVGIETHSGFSLELDKPKGGDFTFTKKINNIPANRLVEAPYIEGGVTLKSSIGISLDVDAFVVGTRLINTGVDILGSYTQSFKSAGRVSYGLDKMGGKWSLAGSRICLNGKAGAGVVFRANAKLGAVTKLESLNFAINYDQQYPTQQNIDATNKGWVGGTWYQFGNNNNCYLNKLPTVTLPNDQNLAEDKLNTTIEVLSKVTDEDKPSLKYHWSVLWNGKKGSYGATTNKNLKLTLPSLTEGQAGKVTVKLTITDDVGETAHDEVIYTYQRGTTPPPGTGVSLSLPGTITIKENETHSPITITTTGVRTTDTLTCVAESGTISNTKRSITITAPAYATASSYEVVCTVYRNSIQLAQAATRIDVIQQTPPDTVTLNITGKTTLEEGELTELQTGLQGEVTRVKCTAATSQAKVDLITYGGSLTNNKKIIYLKAPRFSDVPQFTITCKASSSSILATDSVTINVTKKPTDPPVERKEVSLTESIPKDSCNSYTQTGCEKIVQRNTTYSGKYWSFENTGNVSLQGVKVVQVDDSSGLTFTPVTTLASTIDVNESKSYIVDITVPNDVSAGIHKQLFKLQDSQGDLHYASGNVAYFWYVFKVEPKAIPKNLAVTQTEEGALLSWDALTGATNYQPLATLDFTDSRNFSSIDGLPNSHFVGDTGFLVDKENFTTEKTWYFAIKADNGEASQTVKFVWVDPITVVPPVLTATPADGKVSLSWQPVATAISYDLCYTKEETLNSGVNCNNYSSAVLLNDITSPNVVTGLDNDADYHFVLIAHLPNDTSVENFEIIATPKASTPVTGKLNDTGITQCADNTRNDLTCPVSTHPNQDAQTGRDVTHNDDSDGHAGFSFTKISSTGAELPASATQWSCVKDNVTGLIWEVKTTDGGLHDKNNTYTWYNPDSATNGGDAGTENGDNDTDSFVTNTNNAGYCGAHDWRMPNREELKSLVDYGIAYSGPTIDTAYFPNAASAVVWSSSPYANSSDSAWSINFGNGYGPGYKNYSKQVRLVRSGQ